jgi:hypothetical protein
MRDKIDFIQMNEGDLIDEILLPLFRKMGFQGVYKYHGGAGEKGKDIIFWEKSHLGTRKNYAIVVKAVKLSGQVKNDTGTAGEIVMQVRQCFGSDFTDQMTGEQQKVHECWVVSNKDIPKEAIDAITAGLDVQYSRNTIFLNGNGLWELVEEYLLPITSLISQINTKIEEMDKYYIPKITLTGKGTYINLQEKYPGASLEKPIEVHTTFSFPKDNPDSERVKNELLRTIETGTPVTVPSEFIESVEFPEFMRALFGLTRFEKMSLKIDPIPGDRLLPIKIDLLCDDGELFTLNYLQLRLSHAGTKQFTFTNTEPNAIVQLKLILTPEDKTANIIMDIKWEKLNIVQMLDNLKLQRCLSKPVRIMIVVLESGITLFDVKRESIFMPSPSPVFINIISDLAAIQVKIKRPIIYPNRKITDDEWKIIAELRQILHEGVINGTWSCWDMNIRPLPEKLRELLAKIDTDQPINMRIDKQDEKIIFDTIIPLGLAEYYFIKPKISNIDYIRSNIEELSKEGAEVHVLLEPSEDNRLEVRYTDWIPNTQSEIEK